MSLSFINHLGHQMVITPTKAPPKRAATVDSYHKGWRVVGYSPEHLAEAKRLHDLEQDGKPDAKPFDEAIYMRISKPRPVRSKPYEIHEAALQCEELARRAGWKLVQSVAKAKGGA